MFAQKIQLRLKSALSRGAVFHAIIWATPRLRDISSSAFREVMDLRSPVTH
jgi:hypothetical protein